MSCPANTILANAAANGFFKLDDRAITIATIATLLPGAGNPTANQVMASAAANGFQKPDDRSLQVATAQVLCNNA